jgi:hypothetical protein
VLETNRQRGASLTVATGSLSGEVLIMRRLLILAGLILVIPGFASAQHRGGMAGAGQPVAVSPHVAVSPAQVGGARVATGVHPGAGVVIVHRAGVSPNLHRVVNIANLPVFRMESSNVPGLGFDFAHSAAVHGRRFRRERFFGANSSGFGGFLLFPPATILDEGQFAENQPVGEEMAVANGPEGENFRGSDERNFSGSASTPLGAPAPQHDPAEYVFVRRDGGLVFAVAYSWDHGTLRYITREGLRGSVGQGALDMEATQQFNEQRGVDFRLPA